MTDWDSPAALGAAYEHCRTLHRVHGRSYYLAARLLPAWKRRHVHALYGLTRHTDDIVDTGGDGPGRGAHERARRLDDWEARFWTALDDGDTAGDPVLAAVTHTIAVFGLPRGDFAAFFASMRMDLHVRGYRDYPALLKYMEGSAAVIGTLMLPILLAADEWGEPGEAAAAVRAAREPARQLGLAFQLTNFIRDVAEDSARGRVYLPAADLDLFGVRRADLAAPRAALAVRRLIGFEIGRARWHYQNAAPGVAMLPPRSRRCIRLATAVYAGILDRIERRGYDVLSGRAVVPRRQRVAAVARELARPA